MKDLKGRKTGGKQHETMALCVR